MMIDICANNSMLRPNLVRTAIVMIFKEGIPREAVMIHAHPAQWIAWQNCADICDSIYLIDRLLLDEIPEKRIAGCIVDVSNKCPKDSLVFTWAYNGKADSLHIYALAVPVGFND